MIKVRSLKPTETFQKQKLQLPIGISGKLRENWT